MHNGAVVVVAAARAWAVAVSAAVVVEFAWAVAAGAAVESEWQGPDSEAPLLAAPALDSEVLGYIAASAPDFAQPESAAAMSGLSVLVG